jgi:hypothetical protein
MRTSLATVLSVVVSAALLIGHPAASGMDGVMMQNGKMMMMKAGKAAGPMASDMTMSNGAKVMMDGTMIMKDGTRDQLKDGQMMMMDGKIMEGGKARGMANQ